MENKEGKKFRLVSEEVVVAVTNFIGAKHTYVEAKPFIEALQASQVVPVIEKPVEPVTEKGSDEKESD